MVPGSDRSTFRALDLDMDITVSQATVVKIYYIDGYCLEYDSTIT